MKNTNQTAIGFSIFDRLFNIYPHERQRVLVCWTVRLIYRMIFILAWTMVLSMFVARFGMDKLPFLFVTHALFFILGSTIYMRLVQKYHLNKLIFAVVFASIASLIMSMATIGYSFNIYLLILLFTESFLLIQLTVFFDTFIERFFTPLESQRTFPLVESADTIAGIISGLIFIYFSSSFPIPSFTWILIVLLIIMVPIVLHFRSFAKSIPGVKLFEQITHKKTLTKNIKNGVRLFQQHSFAKNLIMIILLQYAFLILVEFIYTGAITKFSLASHAEVPEAAIGIENAFAHTFGILQLIFSGASLIMQVSIGGRIISWLGIIGGMTLYPVVMLLNTAGLILRFGFFTSVLTKISSEITSVISRNSYQASYYAFREEESEEIRQMIDGMIRPLGTMCGAVLLILAQFFVSEKFLPLTVICIMSALIIADFIIMISTQKVYTKNAVAFLLAKDEEITERLQSVEILLQKGHGDIEPVMLKCLQDPVESDILKIKILKAISDLKYFEALPEITGFLTHPQREMRIASIETLKSFHEAGYFDKNEFSKIKVFETLKSCFWKENDENIRLMILNVISKFKDPNTVKFITDILQNESGAIMAEAIRSLESCADITLGEMLEDYLSSTDPRLVISSAITLWQFPKYHLKIKKILDSMLKSNKRLTKIAGIYIIGVIGDANYKEKFLSLFKNEKDESVKANLAVVLLKLGENQHINYLIDILSDHNHTFSHKLIQMVNEVPENYKSMIDRHIYNAAAYKIHILLKKTKNLKIADMDKEELYELRYCYNLLNSTSDILTIDAILKKRNIHCSLDQ